MVLVVLVCTVCVAEVEMRLQPQKELVRGLRIGLSLTSASFSPNQMVLKEAPLTIRILKRIKSAVSAFQPKKSASSRQKCENHQSSGGCSAGRFWDRFGFYAVQLTVGSPCVLDLM